MLRTQALAARSCPCKHGRDARLARLSQSWRRKAGTTCPTAEARSCPNKFGRDSRLLQLSPSASFASRPSYLTASTKTFSPSASDSCKPAVESFQTIAFAWVWRIAPYRNGSVMRKQVFALHSPQAVVTLCYAFTVVNANCSPSASLASRPSPLAAQAIFTAWVSPAM